MDNRFMHALGSDTDQPHNLELITGLVLAGGGSRRIRNIVADKGLLPWQGKPLAAHALACLHPQVGTVAINANRHIAEYEQLGVPVWQDQRDPGWEDFPGPLAGMLTGLRHCQTPWLATVPCDAPLFPDNLVQKLYGAALAGDVKIAYACCTMQRAQDEHGSPVQQVKDHPVFALIHHSLKDSLYAYLQGGDRKILIWMKQLPHARVLFEEHIGFMSNINTAANLADFCQLTQISYPL